VEFGQVSWRSAEGQGVEVRVFDAVVAIAEKSRKL